MDKDHVKFDWPKEAVLEMVKMWETHECLYNTKHKFYHNKHARYAALNQMADGLKVFYPAIGASEIKSKMIYLRGQYTREVSKARERKSGAGAEDVYVPAAYWYNELSFLNDFIKIRKGGCNLYDENVVQLDESLDSSALESEISPAQPSKRSRFNFGTPQTSCAQSQEESVLAAATNVLQNIASKSTQPEADEKDVAFCNYIKAELKAITNACIKDELMERITMAVFEAKRKQSLAKENQQNFQNFD